MSNVIPALTTDVIKEILDKTYPKDEEGYFPSKWSIADLAYDVIGVTSRDTLEGQLSLLLWNNFPGQDLADSAAKEIVETFSLI